MEREDACHLSNMIKSFVLSRCYKTAEFMVSNLVYPWITKMHLCHSLCLGGCICNIWHLEGRSKFHLCR